MLLIAYSVKVPENHSLINIWVCYSISMENNSSETHVFDTWVTEAAWGSNCTAAFYKQCNIINAEMIFQCMYVAAVLKII